MTVRAFLAFLLLPACSLAGQENVFSFADDHFIEKSEGLRRFLNPPVKRPKPVLTAEKPWEQNPYLFGTVLFDAKAREFRMWYMSYNRGRPRLERTPVLFASSKDGIHWKKPALGQVEFEGSKENNIVLTSLGFSDLYSPSVIEDAGEADPARRFKMLFWDKAGKDSYKDGGMHVAFSPDGIRWTRHAGNPVLKAGRNDRTISDVMDVARDPATGRFVLYGKGWTDESWGADGKEDKEASQRIIVRSESGDFVHWSEPEAVIRHHRTLDDPQSYGMPVFFSDGLWFGLLRSYKLPGDERIDIRLMCSRDGRDWKPVCPGETFLKTGESDADWDDGMIFTAPPFAVGERLFIYYGGWDGPHHSQVRHAAIGLAEAAAGRLSGLTPSKESGELVSTPFSGGTGELFLNADMGGGECRVAVLDESGREIPGFGWADCGAITGDARNLPVRWGRRGLESLPPQKIRLKISLTKGAKLFDFHIPSEKPIAVRAEN